MPEPLIEKMKEVGSVVIPTQACLEVFAGTFTEDLWRVLSSEGVWGYGNAVTRYILRLPESMGGFDLYPIQNNPKQWTLVARGAGGPGFTQEVVDLDSGFILDGTVEENDRELISRVNSLIASVERRKEELEQAKAGRSNQGVFKRILAAFRH